MSSGQQPTLTYAMIKPDAFSRQNEIIDVIKENDFKIVQMRQMKCSPEKLALFYKEHEGKPFFSSLVSFMTSGPIVAMVLSKVDAVAEWRKLIGPTNSLVAKETQPNTIRARFGTDGQCNAVHGSATPSDARREINFFFPNMVVDPLPTAAESQSYLSMHVIPLLSEGLLELCKVKPEDPTEWLGAWLLEHNPNQPAIKTS
ncbi:nucleoside-diphosphate kinase [Monocercomonoides exilis]|uniref:nucleoside-diphosphate kinase n=1 Tax=Monocercomonoides exilis TaxID=2049356 RepID=UPI00355A0080|nr:nucleoside-diphosphate kinase [Monocercomonoides exilis]|eukprot:MONOS_1662.1-p1 / transcript=MONOS_1662.1 / gene=MONOS_1662 / organism=Monocercomonoides_exilis_PA203 / gene_product=nucleoside-diphosphate kinase [EC:2.7.4.6] / transcript_product=nucleoside-diphosphate kinase [EC:2.7.4.6] / location=Mono_scaffold00030:177169-177904(-) / protein_length=201 / sequence_SO=supercontig / SO=protein_coding / is_pseudo=false